jgi:hypothetical protein
VPELHGPGADVLDTSNLERWMRAYLRVFPPGREPRHWGLHNYVDANSSSSWGTRKMLRVAPGEIWLDEVGALVRRPRPSPTAQADRRMSIRVGKRHSATAMRRVFALAALSARITRVYVYHWKATREAVGTRRSCRRAGRPAPPSTSSRRMPG